MGSRPSLLDRLAPGCHCGREAPFERCCGPVIDGSRPAATAEELMRSRYSAYCVGDEIHLLRSWDPDTRPRKIETDARVRWEGLEVLEVVAGGVHDTTGEVTFVATHAGLTEGRLHERSRFRRHRGRWVYVEGTRIS